MTIPMKTPDLVVERAAVVRLLARKALDAGVEIRGGCKLVNLEPGDRGVAVTIQRYVIEAASKNSKPKP